MADSADDQQPPAVSRSALMSAALPGAVTIDRVEVTRIRPEGVRIARFDALDEDVTFLAYYLLAPGQQPEIDFPAE